MKKLNTLLSVVIAAEMIAACTTGGVSPTQTADAPSPRDTPTAGSGSPNPEGTAIASPTARPSDVIKEGSGGPISPEQQEYLDNDPEYNNRVQKLTASFDFWAAPNCTNRAFNPESLEVHIKPIFSVDGTTAAPVLEALMDDGQWHTFTVSHGDYDAQVPVAPEDETDLYEIGPGEGPLEVTGGQGTFLGWDNSGQRLIRYDATGSTTESLNDGGQWEVVKQYPIAHSKQEAVSSCRIPGAEVNAWAKFIEQQDKTTFPANVLVTDLNLMEPPNQFAYIAWDPGATGTAAIDANYSQNPDQLPFRTLAYCITNLSELNSAYPGVDVAIKVVKVVDSAGGVGYIKVVTLLNASRENVAGPQMIPLLARGGNVAAGEMGYSDGTQESLLRQWADTGLLPAGIEDTWFWEMN